MGGMRGSDPRGKDPCGRVTDGNAEFQRGQGESCRRGAVVWVGAQCRGPYTSLDTLPTFYTGKAKKVAPRIWGISVGTQPGSP